MLGVLRNYSLPALLAVALHAALGLFLLRGIDWRPDHETLLKPRIVNATLLVLDAPEPKAAPQPAAAPPPAASDPDRVDPRLLEARRQREAAEQARVLAAEQARRQAEERERRRQQEEREQAARQAAAQAQAEAERQARLDALASSSFSDALAQEAAELQEGEQAELAQTFFQGIRAKVISNWSRPASARNGMQATLRVELVPTGEVVSVALLQSSGDSAFDRSAEAAVRKARRFDVPDEPAVFERRFRRFNLLFNPEDLLR